MKRQPKVISGAQLMAMPERVFRDGARWGRWTYHANVLTLEYNRGTRWYEVDLERCNDAAQVLDWIAQVRHKSWATPTDLGNLVRALDALAGSLQDKVCPMGRNKRFDFGRYLKEQRNDGAAASP